MMDYWTARRIIKEATRAELRHVHNDYKCDMELRSMMWKKYTSSPNPIEGRYWYKKYSDAEEAWLGRACSGHSLYAAIYCVKMVRETLTMIPDFPTRNGKDFRFRAMHRHDNAKRVLMDRGFRRLPLGTLVDVMIPNPARDIAIAMVVGYIYQPDGYKGYMYTMEFANGMRLYYTEDQIPNKDYTYDEPSYRYCIRRWEGEDV